MDAIWLSTRRMHTENGNINHREVTTMEETQEPLISLLSDGKFLVRGFVGPMK